MNESSGVRLRMLRDEDLPFAMEIKNIAGWNQVEDDWRGYMTFAPEGCFLAEWDEEKAGTATAISYENRFGWVGMVLVHPSKRRFGIGTALLKRTISFLQTQGVDCIKLDATPMGKKVYVPLGFLDEYEVTRYQGMAPSILTAEGDGSETPAALPVTTDDLEKIAAFDAGCFGASRAEVLRRLHRRHLKYSYCVKSDGAIRGYIMAREGHEAVQIGPWAAEDGQAAEALFAELLRTIPGRKVLLDVPRPNRIGIELMEKCGFEVQRGFWRMYLGNNRYPGIPEHIYGTAGAEKG